MQAVAITGYGNLSKLEFMEVDMPTVAPHQVLIRVKAASINPLDWKLRIGGFRFVWPLKFRFILGFDAAGIIESVGCEVDNWNVGDHVLAALPHGGGFAEYAVVNATLCAAIPSDLSFVEASTIPTAAISALQAIRDLGRIQPGDHVIINGASGGVGSFAVQIAKCLGCRVTAVASKANNQLAVTLGATTFKKEKGVRYEWHLIRSK